MNTQRCGLALVCFSIFLSGLCQAFAEQSCAQGFQFWEAVSATNRAKRTRQYIIPSLNFSCGGVIRSWTLRRFVGNNGGIFAGNELVFQLWNQVEENGLESAYTLRTEQTHTASTRNDPSYTFEASPAMTVVAGDVFGFYVSTSIGLRLGVVSDAGHIMFTVQTASATEFRFTNPGSSTSPLIFIEFTPFSTVMSSTKEIAATTTSRNEPTSNQFQPKPTSSRNSGGASPTSTASAEPTATSPSHTTSNPHSTSAAGATTLRIEPTSDVFSEPMSSSGRDSASATSSASAEQTTTTQPHSISNSHSTSRPHSTSHLPMPSFPSSTAEEGGGSTDDVSSSDESPAPVIAGVLVAVIVAIILLSLVVAAIICYKAKLVKKYNVESDGRSNGETAMNHDYYTLEPTYVNHPAQDSSYAVLKGPVYATNPASEEYADVPDLVATATTSSNLDESQAYETPIPLGDHYECVTGHTLNSSYLFVPTMEARKQRSTVLHNAFPVPEMENVYEETSLSSPEYENVEYATPANEVEGLYGQLAERKCIEIPRESIRFEQLLGSGQFGEVFKGEWVTPYGVKDVAIKTLTEGFKEEDKVKFLQEAAIMAQFRHPHIVRLLGAVTVDEPNMIVLELLSEGDLLDYLLKQRSNTQCAELPHRLLQFCREVADGMKYLSNKGFVHRDLAARNILLDGKFKCKIADFGLSRDITDDTYYTATSGKIPVKWTAPEALFFKKYSPASDVWSYGMLMKEIWSLGEKPFPSMSPLECVSLLQNNPQYVQPPPPGCPRAVYQQMVLCWNSDHHGRPSFASLLEALSGPSQELLRVPEESLREVKSPEMAARIGADGSFSLDLYLDLQRFYYTC